LILVIGQRSNLSKFLHMHLKNSLVFSTIFDDNCISTIKNLQMNQINIQIVFNNFEGSTNLYSSRALDDYVKNSIYSTAKILTTLDENNIDVDKIVYTSSSSVYGNNKFCSETDPVMPMSLQASLKVANEELIKRFCEVRNIDYTIARIFNMYGGEDRFSVISKIKDAYISNQPLNIINGGVAIRDYVYITDVVKSYEKILETTNAPKIINIASGNGKRVHDMLSHLQSNSIYIPTVNSQRDELKASIANTDLLDTLVDTRNFIQVEDYLLKELRK